MRPLFFFEGGGGVGGGGDWVSSSSSPAYITSKKTAFLNSISLPTSYFFSPRCVCVCVFTQHHFISTDCSIYIHVLYKYKYSIYSSALLPDEHSGKVQKKKAWHYKVSSAREKLSRSRFFFSSFSFFPRPPYLSIRTTVPCHCWL